MPAIVGALTGGSVGLVDRWGDVMAQAIEIASTPLLLASLICITALTIVLFVLGGAVERLLTPRPVSLRQA